jgi:pimeloyl-ACP methyl ester carboxylesterase
MKKVFLSLIVMAMTGISVVAQGFQGSWNGTLQAGAMKLRLVFHVENKNGTYTATMDSPDQGAKGIPVTSVDAENDTITLKVAPIMMAYTGTLSGDTIRGTFTQGGQSFPLILARGAAAKIKRPQDPSEPYPYRSENVRFENRKAGITLAGTLTLPKDGNDFPVAVLISGSGAQNRNEELLNHRPFLVLSDCLTRQGIAVLRYDDRGVAESGGTYQTAGIDDFASDARAAVDYLKTRNEVNPQKIGLIGHSEGGTIAFLLAGAHDDLAYIVSMAGMAVNGDSLLRAQRYLLSRAQGVSDEAIAANELFIDRITAFIGNSSAEYVRENADSMAKKLISENLIPEALKATLPDTADVTGIVKQGLMQLSSPEFQSLRRCDPSDALTKIRCPVFALNGEKDLQAPPDMNLDRIRALVKSELKTKKYPALNHLFQHATTGNVDEYGTIDETLSPEALEDIAAWIRQITINDKR